MGRPERPLDQHTGPIAELAAQLRQLRESAGRPSYRELAQRANFSMTALSQAAGGRTLPTLPVMKAYVRACGGDVGEWETRWQQLAGELRETAPLDEGEGVASSSGTHAPYLGLASYGVADAGLYFGREALTRELVGQLTVSRFLAVFGSSGSGKSSLLRAGLMATVADGGAGSWTAALLTPGARPLTALAAAVAPLAGLAAGELRADLLADPGHLHAAVQLALAGQPAGAELILVIDQFEEVFSAGSERDGFVDALLAAVGAPDARTRVVVAVRADFYGECARWPRLVTTLRNSQLLVGPMSSGELHDAIVEPAARIGVHVERALVATVIADADREPGALPLASHALLETWRGSPPGRLTLAAYQAAGGVSGAIATTAEAVYADCDDDQQQMLRRVFLRLIALGDGGPDTRRRVASADLAAGSEPGRATALVERLARARLVTVDEDGVQIAHEALIRSWPRLTEWLAEGRAGLRIQRGLAESASAWAGYGRDPAALYRGAPLAAALSWAGEDGGRTGLTAQEQEFLDASSAAEAAERVAAVRTSRRLRALVGMLLALLLAVSGAAGVAVWQRQTALTAERAAMSGQLAAQSLAFENADPDAASLAALAAWHAMPTVTAGSALLSTMGCCASPQATMLGEQGNIDGLAFSPDGRLLASGGDDDKLHLWDTATGTPLAALTGHTAPVNAIAFSPAGQLVATGSADDTIRIWRVATRRTIETLTGDTDAIEDLAFAPGPSGQILASASRDGTVRIWNLSTGHADAVLPFRGSFMRSVAFSPDGKTLATGGSDMKVTLWNIADLSRPELAQTLTGATKTIISLAYSPGGKTIAATETNGGAMMWSTAGGTGVPLRGGTHTSTGLAFSSDGSMLFSGASYDHLLLWDSATGRQLPTGGEATLGDVTVLAFSPATDSIAVGGLGGALRIWRSPVPRFTGHTSGVAGVTITPDGTTVASVGSDRTLRTWNRAGQLRVTVRLPKPATTVAISPDGRFVVTGGHDNAVTVRSLPDLTLVTSFPAGTSVSDVAFAARSGTLVAASAGTKILMWDIGTRQPRASFSAGTRVNRIAFSPDGRALAAVTNAGTVLKWTIGTTHRIVGHATVSGPLDAVSFSPDGRVVATAGSDGEITLWSAARLKPLAVLPGPLAKIQSLAFSHDDKTLAAAESNGTITLWRTSDDSQLATLTDGHQQVNSLAFTPDGTSLISGANSGRIISWTLDPATVFRQDCQILANDPGRAAAENLVPFASYPALCP